MSSGLACIANDIPANREVLGGGEFGLLTAVGDCDNLYRSMRALATDANVRQHWGQQARARAASTYSIEAVAKQYIELYRNLLSGNIQ
jgi:glycosyltransferase involved in cell wall biosynthesis